MSGISRRKFLAGAAAVAGAAAFPGRQGFALEKAKGAGGAAKAQRASDIVTLGKTGIQTSVLGIGTGTHGGREQLGLGQADFTKLVRHALDRGIRYIDTADRYCTHLFVRLALEDVKPSLRSECFIQTKTPAKSAEVARADIERYRRELKIDHIDSLLMHCMQQGEWPRDMRPVMDALYEEKEKGRVRAVGVSCHGFDPLVAATDCDWIDTHLVRINPFGAKMDDSPKKVAAQMKEMHGKGRGVLGMKIFGETGFDSREQRFQSLKYVLGLGCVDAFTIGFTSPRQIDETMDMIEEILS